VLHYERNAATLQQEDMVLIDAGAEFRCYTADITRTFPAAGRFSAAQRDLYEAVLATQLHALELIKPGGCGFQGVTALTANVAALLGLVSRAGRWPC
jgi:Xaa-Pro aminopeptidase